MRVALLVGFSAGVMPLWAAGLARIQFCEAPCSLLIAMLIAAKANLDTAGVHVCMQNINRLIIG